MNTKAPATGPEHTSASTARLGAIGLGSMGLPMARRLLGAHGSLVVHSRTRRPDLEREGATWAESPRQLAEQVDAVLVMLPDLPQFEPMLEGEDGLLAAAGNLLVMIGSTSSPGGVRALARHCREASGGAVQVVDTPVSGGVGAAENGTLSIMAGGADAEVERATELLAPCGTLRHQGPIGAGEVTKACNQMVVASTMMALADATVLAERSGISPSTLFDALEGGFAGSNLLAAKRAQLENADYAPGGKAVYMTKDLSFAGDVASETGTDPALLGALQEAYAELVAAGLGEEDLTIARRFVAERGA